VQVATEERKKNVWLIVGIVVAALVLLLCLCGSAFFVLPVLFGPAIEQVFSDIVEELE
jgi:hypothetical protein